MYYRIINSSNMKIFQNIWILRRTKNKKNGQFNRLEMPLFLF